MPLDLVPIWLILIVSLGLVLSCVEIGFLLGRRRRARGGDASEVSGAMVGAAMGLLAFMLAFTFNGAATRHDARKALVVDDANAIERAWLRADLLAEPHRTDLRGLLRSYVDLRVQAAAGEVDLARALAEASALQDRMWSLAMEAIRSGAAAVSPVLIVQPLNDVFDVHLKRVTVGIRNRVPPTIWLTLGLLIAVGMTMMGAQAGLSGKRSFGIALALALSFSLVLFLIADLDRPDEGVVDVSQQAMLDLQARLQTR